MKHESTHDSLIVHHGISKNRSILLQEKYLKLRFETCHVEIRMHPLFAWNPILAVHGFIRVTLCQLYNSNPDSPPNPLSSWKVEGGSGFKTTVPWIASVSARVNNKLCLLNIEFNAFIRVWYYTLKQIFKGTHPVSREKAQTVFLQPAGMFSCHISTSLKDTGTIAGKFLEWCQEFARFGHSLVQS